MTFLNSFIYGKKINILYNYDKFLPCHENID